MPLTHYTYPYENSAYFKSIFFLFYILFYTYFKTILSPFLIANLCYFKTILSLFSSFYFETKNREKIALADRDNWMQNRFKIVLRKEKNMVKIAWH